MISLLYLMKKNPISALICLRLTLLTHICCWCGFGVDPWVLISALSHTGSLMSIDLWGGSDILALLITDLINCPDSWKRQWQCIAWYWVQWLGWLSKDVHHHWRQMMLTWFFFCFCFFGDNVFLLLVSTERNDQTEQEERREIKQRLNRKVGSGCTGLSHFLKLPSI